VTIVWLITEADDQSSLRRVTLSTDVMSDHIGSRDASKMEMDAVADGPARRAASLPSCCTVAVFKSRLKTFIFSQAFSSFSAH